MNRFLLCGGKRGKTKRLCFLLPFVLLLNAGQPNHPVSQCPHARQKGLATWICPFRHRGKPVLISCHHHAERGISLSSQGTASSFVAYVCVGRFFKKRDCLLRRASSIFYSRPPSPPPKSS